ncbi:MAG: anthranilate phosphoribosyltransferase [Deltaproteobacteria bacterium]|nr:anthranilate phosphoribosyltransferase [Deltaproteobacteria bacterium]
MIREYLTRLVDGVSLTESEMETAMDEIMSGEATPAQIGAFITALRIKGETVDEITGAAKVMRKKATKVNISPIKAKDGIILDVVGTGGDGAKSFNVSTATAFVTAGAGITVAKHGNRAVSSRCGAADVLEGLGVNLNIKSTDVEQCINETGIGFLFAPLFHGAMKHAAGPRKEIGIRSVFNLLGPLTNPAGATVLVLGVYNMNLTEKIAMVINRLGVKEAFVVCGEGNLDEISICGFTKISHVKDGIINTFKITPEEAGLKRADIKDIEGGDASYNARIINDILDGIKGPKRDMVLFNASAAFVAAGYAKDFNEGVMLGEKIIDSGKAKAKLDELIRFTSSLQG